MNKASCNCIVCAEEYSYDELQTMTLASINNTRFKICQKCLDMSNPAEDYKEAREIINAYFKLSDAKNLFKEAKSILDSRIK